MKTLSSLVLHFAVLPAVLFALMLGANRASAQTPDLTKRDVVTGLKVPVEITWGPDDWIWFAEKGGRVGRVNPTTGEIKVVYQVTDLWESNEAGLLGMAVYPTLRDSPYVFLAWTYFEEAEVRMRLVRFRYDGRTLRDSTMIFHRVAANAYTDGGRLTVTPDRHILMTVGDADQDMFAQSPWFLGGKVLRMNLDGSVPSDNPSVGAPTPVNLLWSWGHRDGRGIVALPSGTVFEAEQGKDSVDELNVIQRRRNYGWPRVIGTCDQVAEQKFCSDSNVVAPVRMWRSLIYPSGIDYYNSAAIPEFANSLLLVTLDERDLRQLKLSGSSVTAEIIHYDNEFGRLRDLCIAPDGRIFLATSNRDEKGIGSNYPGSDKIIELGGNRALALLGTPEIRGDSALAFNAGDPVSATFSASNFDPSNVFTLEISDANGSFAAPRVIATLQGRNGDTLNGFIPCDTSLGSRYHFRIRSSSPAQSKTDQSTGYRIIAAPPAVISPAVGATICPGDSVTLRARIGGDNHWSNGMVGDSIRVGDAGAYFVVSFSNGCPRYSDTIAVTISPLPAPVIQLLGTNTLDAGARFAAYQWYRNDTLIEGAVSRSYVANEPGTYTVRVRNNTGCWNTSQPFVLEFSGVEREGVAAGVLRVSPHPVRERLALELAEVPGGAVEILISDMSGRQVVSLREDAPRGRYRREIDTRSLGAGAYVVRLQCGGKAWSARFVRE
jgi:glucose/arabinose dehydrogenase